MKFTETSIAGVWLIDLEPRADERGYFARTWCEQEFAAHGLSTRIAQANTGVSPRRGTLRGIHYQEAPHAEVKVVRCTRGAVHDVVVDLRPESPTHRRWLGVALSARNGRTLYAPAGCAHGYLTLEDDTELLYMTSDFYAPAAARGVRYDDPAFDITWPGNIELVSAQDRSWPDYAGNDASRRKST